MAQHVAQRVPVVRPATGWWTKFKKILFGFFVLSVFAMGIASFVALGVLSKYRTMLPPVNDLKARAQISGTKIFSQDGHLLAEFAAERREWRPLSQIPQVMKSATIAIEDERYYQHRGADFIGIARAMFQNVVHMEIRQGGSTIPEQLAKVIYLTNKRTMSRRVTQMLLALEIEKRYSKDEILEMYLNKIYYGAGAHGVQAAAKLYFDKDISQVTLAEAATLAGIPKSPERYSPFEEPYERHQESALQRRNLILQRMADLGVADPSEVAHAKQMPLKLARPRLFGNRHFRAPHFAMYVKSLLNEKFSDEMLRNGGYRVYTTLNTDMQMVATDAVRRGLENVASRDASQCALVCIDPRTGHILAMVGGKNFYDRVPSHHGQLNRAVQSRRQPGSSFKVYVYTAALELLGKTPDSTVVDSPISFPGGSSRWSPKNYDGRFKGAMSYRTALALSRNVPAVKVANEVGITNVIRIARAMGIRSQLDPYLPLALGANGLTPLEHTSGIGVIAAGGIRAEPTAIERITGYNGEVIWEHSHTSELRRVISRKTAEQMHEMMIGVVEHGTGRKARIEDVAVAGKTGTTNNHNDAWFVGFTPDIVAGVWMGNDNNTPMQRGTGGEFCAPIWKDFMERAQKIYQQQIVKDRPNQPVVEEELPKEEPKEEEKPKPTTKKVRVSICNESGLVARSSCPETHTESFSSNNRPWEKCDLHDNQPSLQSVTICAESGLIASKHCPHQFTETIPRDQIPMERCGLHRGPPKVEPSERLPSPAPPDRIDPGPTEDKAGTDGQ